MNKIATNITTILSVVKDVFGKIGREGGGGGIKVKLPLYGETGISVNSDVQNGIQAVQGLGGVLKETADGLKGWSELTKAGIDVEAVSRNIKTVLEITSKVFGELGTKSKSYVNDKGQTV